MRLLLCTFVVSAAFSGPVTFEMIVDGRFRGKAVLQGELGETPFVNDRFSIDATKPGGGPTEFWFAHVEFTATGSGFSSSFNIVDVTGRHKKKGHDGESEPGPPLGALGSPPFEDLAGVKAAPSPLVRTREQPHDQIPHRDIMTATLFDLDPRGPTVLFTGGTSSSEVRLIVDFVHTPEPATAAATLGGLGLLGWLKMRNSRRKR